MTQLEAENIHTIMKEILLKKQAGDNSDQVIFLKCVSISDFDTEYGGFTIGRSYRLVDTASSGKALDAEYGLDPAFKFEGSPLYYSHKDFDLDEEKTRIKKNERTH